MRFECRNIQGDYMIIQYEISFKLKIFSTHLHVYDKDAVTWLNRFLSGQMGRNNSNNFCKIFLVPKCSLGLKLS